MFANSTPAGGKFTRKISSRNNMGLTNVPHLEWNVEGFQRSSPELPPSVAAEITTMPRIHVTFGRILKKPVSPCANPVLAFSDTGAQTCSAGTEIQKLLGYPNGFLVSTTHRIRGITYDRLRNNGVLFLCRRVGMKEVMQAVYMSDNTPGFYWLQTALKDLDLLQFEFPTSFSQSSSSTIQ